tara:strand:+ start:119492 stop:120415 length:924 start_codon:yes stop_codon:yes gene_type:complete
MIANFFNKTKPINTLLIIVLLFFIYTISLLLNTNQPATFYFISKRVLYFILLLIILFSVNFIVRKNNLTKSNSYSILLFVCLLGMFPFSILNFNLAIVNLILLFAYRRIYSLRTTKDTKEKLFDSSLWIGIATLIYPWSSLTLFLTFAAIYLFDKFTVRNILIPMVGFIVPIFIYSAYLIAINSFDSLFAVFNFEYSLSFEAYNSLKLLIPLTIVTALIIWSIFPTTLKINAINNEFKNSWLLLVFHFFLLTFVVLPWPTKNGSEFLFLFFPMAIIFTNYLQIVEENWFKELFLYALLAVVTIVFFL